MTNTTDAGASTGARPSRQALQVHLLSSWVREKRESRLRDSIRHWSWAKESRLALTKWFPEELRPPPPKPKRTIPTPHCEACGARFRRITSGHTHCNHCRPFYALFSARVKAEMKHSLSVDRRASSFRCKHCGGTTHPNPYVQGLEFCSRKCAEKWRYQRYKPMYHKPERRLLHRLRNRLRKILQGKNMKSMTRLLGCSCDQFRDWIQSKFLPGMQWNNMDLWHVDHIVPCASFDQNDPKQLAQCWHYTNLQPLWARDNLSKGARTLTQPNLSSHA